MLDQMMTLDDQVDNPWQEFKNPWTDGTSPPRDVMIEFSTEVSGELCFVWIAFLSPPPGKEDVRDVVWQVAGREYDYRQYFGSFGARLPTRWRWPIDPETGRVLERKFTDHPRSQKPAAGARVQDRILSSDDIKDIDVETLPVPQKYLIGAAKVGVDIGVVVLDENGTMAKSKTTHLKNLEFPFIVLIVDRGQWREQKVWGPKAYKQSIIAPILKRCAYLVINTEGEKSDCYPEAASFAMSGRGNALIIETVRERCDAWAAWIIRGTKGKTRATWETAGNFPVQGDVKREEVPRGMEQLGPVIDERVWGIITNRVAELVGQGFTTDPKEIAEVFEFTNAAPQMSAEERLEMKKCIAELAADMIAARRAAPHTNQ